MWFFRGLLCVVVTLGTVTSTPPCMQVTHSECGDDDGHLFNELTVPDKASCQTICAALGSKCHFSLYDNEPFARGNCRLYDEDFLKYTIHCNEIAGPKESPAGCNIEFPPDDNCQTYRYGHCDYEEAQENEFVESWENCQAFCHANSLCKAWEFLKEEKLCKLLHSEDKSCTWEFSPRIPSEGQCDVPQPTTSTTTTTTTTTTITTTTTKQQRKCEQKGKNPLPGVHCSHDFYCCDRAGDTSPTLCTCTNGLWYNQDIESCMWGDIMEPPCEHKTVGHNIDEFTRADHECSDGTFCE